MTISKILGLQFFFGELALRRIVTFLEFWLFNVRTEADIPKDLFNIYLIYALNDIMILFFNLDNVLAVFRIAYVLYIVYSKLS